MGFALGAFVALHGLVHLLYLGQATRLFELQSGMRWPDGSWAFSGLLGESATRNIAAAACALAAIGFVAARHQSLSLRNGRVVTSLTA